MKLPLYFPSISSVKTNFDVIDYLKLINASGVGNFLMSAYDIHNQEETTKQEIISLLKELKQKGVVILMDSGNYESYWYKDKIWNIDLHNEILKLELVNFNFSFDNQNIMNKSISELTKTIINNTVKNQDVTNSLISPIIHAYNSDLEIVCKKVVNEIKPKLIAIPERILGDGIISRINKLKQIRRSLNELGFYTPIHLLGTGSPFSLLLFTWAGADTYDGLEWCQTTIDPVTLQTYHFQLRELFYLKNELSNYSKMTLFNNLMFYSDFNRILQNALESNTLNDLLLKYFNKDFLSKLA